MDFENLPGDASPIYPIVIEDSHAFNVSVKHNGAVFPFYGSMTYRQMILFFGLSDLDMTIRREILKNRTAYGATFAMRISREMPGHEDPSQCFFLFLVPLRLKSF